MTPLRALGRPFCLRAVKPVPIASARPRLSGQGAAPPFPRTLTQRGRAAALWAAAERGGNGLEKDAT